jgi:hypothetical protein
VKPPSSTAGTVGIALGLLAAGGAGAALAVGVATKGKGDALGGAILTIEAGVFGVLAAGFGGLVLAAAAPRWRAVGDTAALVGIGAPVVLGVIGLTKATIAQAETPQLVSIPPQTYTITQANSGQTLSVNVGDTLNVTLDATQPAPTVSTTGVLSAGSVVTPVPATGGSSTGSQSMYPYTAIAAGTVTLTSTPSGSGQGGSAFTLTVTAS